MFKPDVVIEAAYDKWALSGKPGYDIWDWDMMQPIMDLPYVKLSDGELGQVIGTFSKGGG
jgi:hypothetical protein